MAQTLVVHIRDNFSKVFVARMIEWEHSIGLMAFGLVLILQPSLFTTATGYAGFRVLWDSADFWGLAAMTVGAARFAVLTVNGTIRRSPHLRALCAMLSAAFWLQAGYGGVIEATLSPVTGLYLLFVGWEFAIFVACVRYAKLEDIGAAGRVGPPNA